MLSSVLICVLAFMIIRLKPVVQAIPTIFCHLTFSTRFSCNMKITNKMETKDKQIRHFLTKSNITSPFGVSLKCIQIVNELCLTL